jgi:hypothetical protein
MIRPMRTEDVPSVKALQCGYEWKFGQDFFGAWVVEEDGRIVAVIGFWKRAECHMVMDHTWKTPHDRFEVLRDIHQKVAPELKQSGFHEIWTFMDDMRGFGNKLKTLGWHIIQRTVWGRRTD